MNEIKGVPVYILRFITPEQTSLRNSRNNKVSSKTSIFFLQPLRDIKESLRIVSMEGSRWNCEWTWKILGDEPTSLFSLPRLGLFGSFRLIDTLEWRGKRPRVSAWRKIEKLSRMPQVHSRLAAEELLDNTILSLFLFTIAEINNDWNN